MAVRFTVPMAGDDRGIARNRIRCNRDRLAVQVDLGHVSKVNGFENVTLGSQTEDALTTAKQAIDALISMKDGKYIGTQVTAIDEALSGVQLGSIDSVCIKLDSAVHDIDPDDGINIAAVRNDNGTAAHHTESSTFALELDSTISSPARIQGETVEIVGSLDDLDRVALAIGRLRRPGSSPSPAMERSP